MAWEFLTLRPMQNDQPSQEWADMRAAQVAMRQNEINDFFNNIGNLDEYRKNVPWWQYGNETTNFHGRPITRGKLRNIADFYTSTLSGIGNVIVTDIPSSNMTIVSYWVA